MRWPRNSPAGRSIDALNDAWNKLHTDVCGRGLRASTDAQLCAELTDARERWREWWQSVRSVTEATDGFNRYEPQYRAFRARAIAGGITLTAPPRVLSPLERAKREVRAGFGIMGGALVKAAILIGLAVLVSRQLDKGRR